MEYASIATTVAIGMAVLYMTRRTAQKETSTEILKAVKFAEEFHKKQKRKMIEQRPYICHPIRVAELVASVAGDNIPLIQAALLHDTVEDTDATFEDIEREFGMQVCMFVREVTDDKTLSWQERKRLQIVHAPTLTRGAKILKLSDKIANLEDLLLGVNGSRIPVGWDVRRVQDTCLHSFRVYEGLKGLNKELDTRFVSLVSKSFMFNDGRFYSAMRND